MCCHTNNNHHSQASSRPCCLVARPALFYVIRSSKASAWHLFIKLSSAKAAHKYGNPCCWRKSATLSAIAQSLPLYFHLHCQFLTTCTLYLQHLITNSCYLYCHAMSPTKSISLQAIYFVALQPLTHKQRLMELWYGTGILWWCWWWFHSPFVSCFCFIFIQCLCCHTASDPILRLQNAGLANVPLWQLYSSP